MIRRLSLGVLMTALVMPTFADVPKKRSLGTYSQLWKKSMFTVPPEVEEKPKEEKNPLEEYTLAGVSQMKGGWFVVLINKKKRDDRVKIHPNEANTLGFEVVSVEDGTHFLETRVEIKTRGNKTGWVEYDKKFIALKKAAPKPAPRGGKGNPGRSGQRPPIPSATSGNKSGSGTSSRGRVRRVPTPPSK